ncbi:MAG: FctA domain-containing protein [Firmicutes bacterium]|nr:FctA domain-containing protein [Bacillota bacterium]
MTKTIHTRYRALIMTVLIFMCCTLAAPAVHAADQSPKLPLEVAMTLEGTLPQPAETYTITMQADDEAYPMPEGSENGLCSISITGENTAAFPVIRYDKVGVYGYTVCQEPGSNSKCTYDDTVYMLTVYVTNSEAGDGLEISAALYEAGKDEKLAEVTFHNKYETEKIPPTGPRTGDDMKLTLVIGVCALALVIMVIAAAVGKRRRVE